ncbi:MAG TPA: PilZ domain-containing protein [Sphingomicrobium sp.]
MGRQQGFTKRAPRVDIRRPAVMIDSDGRESDVVILDVSSGGFRLQLPESPRIGEFVTLRVERGEEYPTQIRWALGDEAGGVFLTSASYERWEDGRGKAVAEDRSESGDRREGEDRRKGDRREDQRLDRDGVQRDRRGGDRRGES